MQQQRRRFTQTETLEQRLSAETEKLRKLARGTPPGIERERLAKSPSVRGASADGYAQPSCGRPPRTTENS